MTGMPLLSLGPAFMKPAVFLALLLSSLLSARTVDMPVEPSSESNAEVSRASVDGTFRLSVVRNRTRQCVGVPLTSIRRWNLLYRSSFDSPSAMGWTSRELSTGLTNDWQHGFGGGRSGVDGGLAWSDPSTSAGDGIGRIRGTDLGGVGWNGEYNISTDSHLTSPTIRNPFGDRSIAIRFSRWLTKSANAVARISIVEPASGMSFTVWQSGLPASMDTAWNEVLIPVDLPVDLYAFQVRFELDGGLVANAGGWNIDMLEVLSSQAVELWQNRLRLEGETEVAWGESPTLEVSGAQQGDLIYLFYASRLRPSPGSPDLAGMPLPVPIGPAVAALDGTASFQLPPTPLALVGRTIYFEAASSTGGINADSNMLPMRGWL